MPSAAWRGARPLVAPLVVLLLAVGCGGSTPRPTAAMAAPSTPGAGSPPAATSQPAAVRLLDRAAAATQGLRSYAFTATETVASGGRTVTRLSGRVVRDRGVAYDVVTGGRRTQVVRVSGVSYLRPVPGRWSRLSHPRNVADPTASLLAVLRDLTAVSATGSTVRGALPPPAAKRAGIPTDGRPANVSVTVDGAGRVAKLEVDTSTNVGAHSVTVSLTTRYAEFDRAAPIHAPA